MKYIIANWKSNKTLAEIETWFEQFKPQSHDKKVIVAPCFAGLLKAHELKNDQVDLAVQDVSPFPAGAYTGAVSTINLQGLDIKYAIVGHSERRKYFHETHQDVANKVAQCVENNIIPIVCVDDEYISDQAAAIDDQYLEKCIVAYEELGAIGTGANEPIEHVLKVKDLIISAFGQVPVIYGGSVTPANATEYLAKMDGVLVGGASLDAEKFASIVS